MRAILAAHNSRHELCTMAYKGHTANIKETTQIKKKPRKQKRKHANKKENTQTKKKTGNPRQELF